MDDTTTKRYIKFIENADDSDLRELSELLNKEIELRNIQKQLHLDSIKLLRNLDTEHRTI